MRAKLISLSHPRHHDTLANILLKGGVVGTVWGHHLYFLACNACDRRAVARMNALKGRSKNQTFASPGAVEEAEEFADLQKSTGLIFAARKMGMSPKEYLQFLYRKFPMAVELFAKENAPKSVTFATATGKTIWIAGHMSDRTYSKLLETIRNLRKAGKNIVFAGTSLNLAGDNTLTVKELNKVIKFFGDKIDALSLHPKAKSLKKLCYSTSSSVVSFTSKRPRLLRVGCSAISTLKKYIPALYVAQNLKSTRKLTN